MMKFAPRLTTRLKDAFAVGEESKVAEPKETLWKQEAKNLDTLLKMQSEKIAELTRHFTLQALAGTALVNLISRLECARWQLMRRRQLARSEKQVAIDISSILTESPEQLRKFIKSDYKQAFDGLRVADASSISLDVLVELTREKVQPDSSETDLAPEPDQPALSQRQSEQ